LRANLVWALLSENPNLNKNTLRSLKIARKRMRSFKSSMKKF